MMKQLYYLILLAVFIANSALADEAAIRAEMGKKFPYSQILSISLTPYLGLYEVVFDDQLVYTDKNMTYLFSGNIIDLRTLVNLTEAREKQLYAIKFDALPFDLALKKVMGNGGRRLVVFADPNCQYCKKLEKEMVNLTDATVYTFILSRLPGSEEKAKAIWCSPDRLNAWEDQMLMEVEPQADTSCDTSALNKITLLAKTHRINLTPTLVFEDGVIRPGTLTLDKLDQLLTDSIPSN